MSDSATRCPKWYILCGDCGTRIPQSENNPQACEPCRWLRKRAHTRMHARFKPDYLDTVEALRAGMRGNETEGADSADAHADTYTFACSCGWDNENE